MWYPDKDELIRERVVTRLVSLPQPSLADRPVANAAASLTDGNATLTPSAAVATAGRSAPGDPTASAGAADGTVRAKIPAELLKRFSTAPRKPAVVPPAAAK